ncbi:MAG: O-acetyl-ADP-ribose deacetylase (regulator of RNase III) [Pseudoalteromonas tetraodonis]|jgi:O-acetyl-ADP-ribose deacetylase (regulator of RNase III)
MRIIIVNRSKEATDAFAWHFRNLPAVEMHLGGFEGMAGFDCIATAGNSFGLMDAGIDLAMLRFFGRQLMEVIQARILSDYCGEQPVGTSFILETGHAKFPLVAHTPTMRAPMNISRTDNVYLATWATLLAVEAHNRNLEKEKIEVLVLPGFGTGSGGVELIEAATQMRLAIEYFLNRPERITPQLAQARYEAIHYGGKFGFEHPR